MNSLGGPLTPGKRAPVPKETPADPKGPSLAEGWALSNCTPCGRGWSCKNRPDGQAERQRLPGRLPPGPRRVAYDVPRTRLAAESQLTA
jgi:hypothetical protein